MQNNSNIEYFVAKQIEENMETLANKNDELQKDNDKVLKKASQGTMTDLDDDSSAAYFMPQRHDDYSDTIDTQAAIIHHRKREPTSLVEVNTPSKKVNKIAQNMFHPSLKDEQLGIVLSQTLKKDNSPEAKAVVETLSNTFNNNETIDKVAKSINKNQGFFF